MKSSESTAAISEALVLLLADLKNPAKTRDGGGGQKRYKYAELPDILDAVRPELAKCLLSLTMEATTDGPTVGVTARIFHASGEWIEYGPLMLPAGSDAQSAGSAITYARRYLLCAVLGIAAGDDDDGARAKRPADVYGEGTSAGATSGETDGDNEPGRGPVAPSVPEPHDHVPGRQLSSGKFLCSWEKSDGTVCGDAFRIAPTVFTEPVQERADIS